MNEALFSLPIFPHNFDNKVTIYSFGKFNSKMPAAESLGRNSNLQKISCAALADLEKGFKKLSTLGACLQKFIIMGLFITWIVKLS